ncbi:hypothetical protein ACOME3_004706 [Neoechinorhynchus agilis]
MGMISSENTSHIFCSCCAELMPDRRVELSRQPTQIQQSCALCMRPFCGAYWPCSNHTDTSDINSTTCLTKLKDYLPNQREGACILIRNEVETDLLKSYIINQEGGTWPLIIVKEMIAAKCLE